MSKYYGPKPLPARMPPPESQPASQPDNFLSRLHIDTPCLVRFVLRDGLDIVARGETLEEEDEVIFGLLEHGMNFALPIQNMLYVREV